MLGGVVLGIAVGVMPGITAGMLLALTLPFTYGMKSVDAIILLVGMFVGGVSGGLVTATLMRIPGEPNAIMTTLDGYPLARRGFPGRALGLGNAASIVGGALSWVALVLLTAPLAKAAILFGPWENFALVLAALALITSLSRGSFLKGMIAALLGVLLAMPGIDETSGRVRLTFDIDALTNGFQLLPVVVGMFALSQIVADTLHIEQGSDHVRANMRGILISLRDYVVHGVNMVRSSLIGIWIGILPGVGATVASIVAYSTAKSVSKRPEEFGTGSEEAIVAAESANNATTGGTLIPLLALGIPGGLADAILLAALIMHNLKPGPLLFATNPEIVNAIMATHLVAHVLMFAIMTGGCVLFARLMLVPRAFLFPLVIVFCVVGSFAPDSQLSDVWIMLAFGVAGLAMEYARFPLAPFVVGFVLGPLAEAKLRTALMSSAGSLAPLVQRPIAAALLAVALVTCLWPLYRDLRRR
ncbi:MAG: tripartite tricarboxylate transporter permease [Alphaproteobacteria bacterium]|nr:tripartite tricarboxylate transporter permease [Alphaproteobacteria bacterium]